MKGLNSADGGLDEVLYYESKFLLSAALLLIKTSGKLKGKPGCRWTMESVGYKWSVGIF